MRAGTSDLAEGYRHYLIKFPAKEDAPDIGLEQAVAEKVGAAPARREAILALG